MPLLPAPLCGKETTAHSRSCCSWQNLREPWWVLPAEVLHGLTFAAMWAATTDYAHQIAPGTKVAKLGEFGGVDRGPSGLFGS